jgi:hypothetical protein
MHRDHERPPSYTIGMWIMLIIINFAIQNIVHFVSMGGFCIPPRRAFTSASPTCRARMSSERDYIIFHAFHHLQVHYSRSYHSSTIPRLSPIHLSIVCRFAYIALAAHTTTISSSLRGILGSKTSPRTMEFCKLSAIRVPETHLMKLY